MLEVSAMGDLLIRNVDERVIGALKSRAEAKGTSLQHEAKESLTRGVLLTSSEKMAIFAELDAARSRSPTAPPATGAEIVRGLREESSEW